MLILFSLMSGGCAATGDSGKSGVVSKRSGSSDVSRQPSAVQRAEVEEAMLRATRFMVEEVSTNGGYVRTYLADLSRRWAEIEAYDTQIWVENGWGGGGTPGVGQLFLDAYNATGEEYYYRAALQAAEALAWGQHESGGWNYLVDFAGDRSLREWYRTIGQNAWGFEEHNHYYGNATFDDNVTTGAATFLLRLYIEKMDPVVKETLDKAIDFILESQYPLGGWPQRYPLMYNYSKGGDPDYTSFYTYNDDVIRNNILFLIDCYRLLGDERFLDPIRRGMNFYLITQQGNLQPGWSQQHDMKLDPASGRSYEPAALSTRRSYDNGFALMQFYELTGDRKFLARIPDLIDWLERVRLPEDVIRGEGRTHPFFIEPETGKALYYHRGGRSVLDESYWINYDSEGAYSYGMNLRLDLERLKAEYRQVSSLSPDEASAGSPLKVGQVMDEPDRLSLENRLDNARPSETEVQATLDALDEQGRWLVTGEWVSDPYRVDEEGTPSNTALRADPETARGLPDSTDQQYISVQEYVDNMKRLIRYIYN